MRWLLEAFLICMNSSALDLLVHVDFPVSDMSDAVKRGGGEVHCTLDMADVDVSVYVYLRLTQGNMEYTILACLLI